MSTSNRSRTNARLVLVVQCPVGGERLDPVTTLGRVEGKDYGIHMYSRYEREITSCLNGIYRSSGDNYVLHNAMFPRLRFHLERVAVHVFILGNTPILLD